MTDRKSVDGKILVFDRPSVALIVASIWSTATTKRGWNGPLFWPPCCLMLRSQFVTESDQGRPKGRSRNHNLSLEVGCSSLLGNPFVSVCSVPSLVSGKWVIFEKRNRCPTLTRCVISLVFPPTISYVYLSSLLSLLNHYPLSTIETAAWETNGRLVVWLKALVVSRKTWPRPYNLEFLICLYLRWMQSLVN